MAETKAIQEKMAEAFGFEAKDKDVRIKYEDDTDSDTFGDKDKVKVIEMKKKRPAFFSPNLIERVNRLSSKNSTTVRPSGLG